MKLYSLMVARVGETQDDEPTSLAHATALESFGYFQRSSVAQFTVFFSKTVAKRIARGQRSTVEQQEYMLHAHVRSNGLAAVAVCDKEYPSRVAYTLLMKVQEDFMSLYSEDAWRHTDAHLPFPALDEMILKYQDPSKADSILKIQTDLDETKVVLHNTIESLLERGTKLDNLVEKSTDLSANSKMFYNTAKKQNSCCGFA